MYPNKINTNMPNIGLVIPEIAFEILKCLKEKNVHAKLISALTIIISYHHSGTTICL